MNGTVLIARHEFLTTFRRRSFLLMAFGVPLVVTLIAAGVTIVKRS